MAIRSSSAVIATIYQTTAMAPMPPASSVELHIPQAYIAETWCAVTSGRNGFQSTRVARVPHLSLAAEHAPHGD
jgi:hypothetical protein